MRFLGERWWTSLVMPQQAAWLYVCIDLPWPWSPLGAIYWVPSSHSGLASQLRNQPWVWEPRYFIMGNEETCLIFILEKNIILTILGNKKSAFCSQRRLTLVHKTACYVHIFVKVVCNERVVSASASKSRRNMSIPWRISLRYRQRCLLTVWL